MGKAEMQASNDDGALRIAPRLIERLLGDLDRALKARDAADREVRRCSDTIRVVLTALPEGSRAEYARRFEAIKSGIAGVESKGGEVYGQVIQLFKDAKRSEWTLPEIFDGLAQRHGTAYQTTPKSKQVYNVVTYLEKAGRLIRIARGRYLVRDLGIGFETADEIAGASGASMLGEDDY